MEKNKEMATEYEILSKKVHKAIIRKAISVIDEEGGGDC